MGMSIIVVEFIVHQSKGVILLTLMKRTMDLLMIMIGEVVMALMIHYRHITMVIL